ncbi:hypothetical protein GQ53DRAFT_751466 [Thozetella sp. PMI_491]|nr:hypothetical protein GQ53DRAFT_751466 [Thozetella sp. PMI_491]
MSDEETEKTPEIFQDDDHKTAYVFDPLEYAEQAERRPSKKRKLSAKKSKAPTTDSHPAASHFVPLFQGTESQDCVRLREELFNDTWSSIDSRIQHVLREANGSTLQDVGTFVRDALEETDKIPAAFIITGRNIASQDLLFEQLGETLREATQGTFIRIRSAEAPNLKSTLKKIIKDATTQASDDDGEVAVGQDGRKYLDYDLEALYASIKSQSSKRVIVAFQDSEAFDGGLLSELIALFRSWRDRIQFTVLFGIATSVELFQARLSKVTAQHLYGGQFDVVQANSVLESVFKHSIASPNAALRIGPSLLLSLIERQQDQVAGIHAFVSSLKYAYMCHFYANPLSVLLSEDRDATRKLLQPEHLEAIRTLGSFKARVEAAVEAGRLDQARSLLEDDEYLITDVLDRTGMIKSSAARLLWSLRLLKTVSGTGSFMDMYMTALEEGLGPESNAMTAIESIRKRTPDEVVALCKGVANEIEDSKEGPTPEDEQAFLPPISKELLDTAQAIEMLQAKCKVNGKTLRNKYQAQNKVVRATVVDQRVQLSQDSAVLSKEDEEFTAIIDDRLIKTLLSCISSARLEGEFLHEAFSYDSKMPHRDVFIPRPSAVLERALSRPHDYLNCACCKTTDGAVAPTFPATSILYHLYCEAGALVNVSDLWTAFLAVVGDESEEGERHALLQFYRGLSELRIMGYVKQSKKKADHVAKLKWL